MNAQTSPSDSLVFECDFDEPPEKVWRALTEPRLLEAWLTAEVPAPSGGAQERSRQATAEDLPPPASADERVTPRQAQLAGYEILTAEPHRRLRYLWRDRESGVGRFSEREVHSIVTIELAPAVTGGTHLRLTQGEFRIVSAAASMAMAVARPTPIARARRRTTPTLSSAGPTSWRRAA